MDSGQERISGLHKQRQKAYDIKVLDLTGIFPVADYFMICTGRSTTSLQQSSRRLKMRLKNASESIPQTGQSGIRMDTAG